jgi:hypothetical protein
MTSQSPFQHLLGEDFERLPAPVRDLHSLSETTETAGFAEIATARNPAAWFLCWVAGLPRPGHDVPVTVAFHPDGKGRETWERHFASRRYASTMAVATGRNAGLLTEFFGPFRLFTRLTAREDGLAWSLVHWRFMGIPLPRWTTPTIECLESGEGNRFVFDIRFGFPLVGHVIHYRGWLERAPTT